MAGHELNSTINATTATTTVEEPSALKWLRISLYVLIFLCGTFGNTLVILAYKNPRMRTVTNLFIANLAVADLTVCLINVPVNITISVLPTWPFGAALCKIIPFLVGITVFSSVGTLVAISVDRYRAIVHPLLPRIRTRHALMMVLAIWTVALIYPIPVLFFTKLVETNGVSRCRERWPPHGARAYVTSVFVVLYVMPLTAISVLYFLISHNLGRSRNVCPAGSQRARRSVIRMLVIVVVLFAACWFPFHIVFIYIEYTTSETAEPPSAAIISLVLFVQWLAFANSACNPLVYAVLNLNYRREFVRILRCQSLAVTKYLDSMNTRNNDASGNFTSTPYRATSQTVAVSTRLVNNRLGRDARRMSLETIREENGNATRSLHENQVSFSDAKQSVLQPNTCSFESAL